MSSGFEHEDAAWKQSSRAAAGAPVCDLCGAPRVPGERRRLVWDSGSSGELVLADMCARCAGQSDRMLELYGGRGRAAVRLTQGDPLSTIEPAPVRRVGGMIVRGLVYVLIALATFALVTLLTSRG